MTATVGRPEENKHPELEHESSIGNRSRCHSASTCTCCMLRFMLPLKNTQGTLFRNQGILSAKQRNSYLELPWRKLKFEMYGTTPNQTLLLATELPGSPTNRGCQEENLQRWASISPKDHCYHQMQSRDSPIALTLQRSYPGIFRSSAIFRKSVVWTSIPPCYTAAKSKQA